MSKHTPGPWHMRIAAYSADVYADEAENIHVAEVLHDCHLADAQLIAAAPALLQECHESLRVAKSWHDNHGPTIECDMLCERIAPLEAVIKNATEAK